MELRGDKEPVTALWVKIPTLFAVDSYFQLNSVPAFFKKMHNTVTNVDGINLDITGANSITIEIIVVHVASESGVFIENNIGYLEVGLFSAPIGLPPTAEAPPKSATLSTVETTIVPGVISHSLSEFFFASFPLFPLF